MKPPFVMVLALALAALPSADPRSQSSQLRDGSSVPSPESEFGKAVGADHFLANYTQLCSYWQKLAQSSDRIRLERIGTTSYGQAMWTAIVTSPANHAKLEVYRLLNERLARAKDTDPRTADRLIQEGKPVVWIDAGMHANESVAAQNIIELSYRL
ncbi:MAG TPA: M14 family zinc carboxypeptidase, partial [Planctomycetota bacterium]|nr:M14 family zinc carboxypeptidase [Planctomycetota bacterium]